MSGLKVSIARTYKCWIFKVVLRLIYPWMTCFSVLILIYMNLKNANNTSPPQTELKNVSCKKSGPRQIIENVSQQTTQSLPIYRFTRPERRVWSVDCRKLIEGDHEELSKADEAMKKHTVIRENDSSVAALAKNCDRFFLRYDYNSYPVTKEELEFPIAFSILVYKESDQLERLLRAIYRPSNLYCIHVDKSSSKELHQAVVAIASCFKNVFLVSKSEDVIYAGFSRLQADLNCMTDLLKYKWKYFINLPSQHYPLKTNLEIVKILKTFNGSNNIEGISEPKRLYADRFKFSHIVKGGKVTRTDKMKKDPPHKVTVLKGSAYGIFSHAFVDYIINNKSAKDILDWSRDVYSPDEYVWATLHFSKVLKVPGGYLGKPDTKPWIAVYVSWNRLKECHGKLLRNACVFGVGDLLQLVSKKQLFANKFLTDYQHLTLDCLEEWMWNKTFNTLPFEMHYYRRLPS